MANPDQDREDRLIHEIRRLALLVVEEHEAAGCNHSPPGRACWTFRCNVLGFLCHSLGVRHARLATMQEQLAIYDRECPGCPGDVDPNPN